jgi:multiple sugar transport system substrate-binding protein
MALCVTTGSKNQAAAFKYISHLTSQAEQNKFALDSLPVWKTSYDDAAVVKTNPAVVPQAKKQLDDLILRPQARNYNAMSQALQAELQKALLGQKPAQKALDDAADKANSLLQP